MPVQIQSMVFNIPHALLIWEGSWALENISDSMTGKTNKVVMVLLRAKGIKYLSINQERCRHANFREHFKQSIHGGQPDGQTV